MKTSTLFFVPVLVFCASTLSANELDDCMKTGSMPEVQQCMEKAQAKVQEEYEAVFNMTEKNVKEFDAIVKNNNAGLKALVSANSAFRHYQEHQCQFERTMMEPGSGAGNVYRQCMIDLYKSQIKLLKKFQPEK